MKQVEAAEAVQQLNKELLVAVGAAKIFASLEVVIGLWTVSKASSVTIYVTKRALEIYNESFRRSQDKSLPKCLKIKEGKITGELDNWLEWNVQVFRKLWLDEVVQLKLRPVSEDLINL